jgi:hypothetical protein
MFFMSKGDTIGKRTKNRTVARETGGMLIVHHLP